MKSGKFLFLAIIFLVSLVCISAVSAADEAVSDVIADTNDDVSNENLALEESDENVLGDEPESEVDDPLINGHFSTLNDDINYGSDEVDLKYNYYYEPSIEEDLDFNGGITIIRDVTINGNGRIISGSSQARIFYIPTGVSVVLKNINFINGNSSNYGVLHDEGGAIWVDEGASCTIINCNFTNNAATYAGAVSGGTVINCTFTNNTATIAGAFGLGDAINCTFIQNTATENGGAIYEYTETCIENCTFIQNTATYGGAIYDGDATGCTFTDNTATYGGAIYDGDATGCTFTDNTATEKGGAIYEGIATNCNFTANNASFGGAIVYGAATGCTFTENTAGVHGGAIYEGNATNCNFKSNKAFSEGGAIYNSWDSDDYAVNCTFINNKAVNGGAMYYGSAENCNFIGNRASYNGGALDNTESTNCNFTNNTAVNEGGAIYSGSPCKNSIFINNYAADGGAIKGSVNIENCTFTSNRAIFGGALSGCSGVTNCTFIGNSATEQGDDAYSTDTENCKFFTPTTVTSKAVSTTYNVNKYLVITLKDFKGKPMSGVYVTVTLSGTKKYKTNSNGQIKINVGKLVPKTYTAKISFAANGNYLASSTTAKVTVKKAAVKLTAKAKTFKVKVKTKKYTVTLKNNKNKVLKKVKLTLKVGKKTYKATTNSKGKATFKITKLTKRGKYTATIKFAGSKYYKALSKKVKITVKK